MPYYEYDCLNCGHELVGDQAIFKRITESDSPEKCPECSNQMRKLMSKGYFVGEKVQEAEFNHGLGCVTKNKKHRDEIAKKMGYTEVGNDKLKQEIQHNPYEI